MFFMTTFVWSCFLCFLFNSPETKSNIYNINESATLYVLSCLINWFLLNYERKFCLKVSHLFLKDIQLLSTLSTRLVSPHLFTNSGLFLVWFKRKDSFKLSSKYPLIYHVNWQVDTKIFREAEYVIYFVSKTSSSV